MGKSLSGSFAVDTQLRRAGSCVSLSFAAIQLTPDCRLGSLMLDSYTIKISRSRMCARERTTGFPLVVIASHAAKQVADTKRMRLGTELAIEGVHVHDDPLRISPACKGVESDVTRGLLVSHPSIESLARPSRTYS